MFKKLMLVLGVTAVTGSSLVAFEHRQSGTGGDLSLDLMLKWQNMLARMADGDVPNEDQRRASLPQNNGQDFEGKEHWEMSGEENLRSIARHNPQVQEYVDRLDRDKQSATWARVRHKVKPDAGGQGRLADIHTRKDPNGKLEEVSREEYDRMGMLDQERYRSSVRREKPAKKKTGGIVWQKKRD